MRSELLLLRLEVLRRGIKDVQEVLEAGNTLFESIKKAQENVDSAWWFVNNILNVAENQKVIQALEAMVPPDGAGGEWTNELRSIKEGLRQARQDGAGLKRQLDAASRAEPRNHGHAQDRPGRRLRRMRRRRPMAVGMRMPMAVIVVVAMGVGMIHHECYIIT